MFNIFDQSHGQRIPLKELRFCHFFVKNGGNATRAYKDAGYQPSNDNVAGASACRLLRSERVRAMIQEIEGDVYAVSEISIEWIASRLYDCVHGLGQFQGAEIKDRLAALRDLGKWRAMFANRQINEFRPYEGTNEQQLLEMLSQAETELKLIDYKPALSSTLPSDQEDMARLLE